VSLVAAALNHLVLQPGEKFSFLHAIKPVQEDFVMGHSLSAGRVVDSKGGGYCQVSTALYNAALLAGFPILERYSHSFYNSTEAYVEPGLDAAVSGASNADFSFENSSAVPLTLTVTAEDGRVTVKIFGALRPRSRWVKLSAERVVHSTLKRKSHEAPGTLLRPGFDGWKVARDLSVMDAHGNTRTLSLGVDHYEMIPELVAEP
jgi:vancomycin resistance protein YoaR